MTFRPSPARQPSALLREVKPLRTLFDRAQSLSRLQILVEAQLQPAARPHCHVATWHNGTLLIIVTDGHWATRLRYQQRRLLTLLQQQEAFAGLTRILFKVQPQGGNSSQSRAPLYLSQESAQSIEQTADAVRDPQLKASLQRLARHTRKPEPR